MKNKLNFPKVLAVLLLAILLLLQVMGCSPSQQTQNAQSILPLVPQSTPDPTNTGTKIKIVPNPFLLAPGPQTQNSEVPDSKIVSSPYTIAWISDTQHYSAEFPDTYFTMTQYLKNNKQDLNLGYVVHTGDLVASGKDTKEWKIAKKAMDELSDIPYGVLAGNHDVGQEVDYTNYSAFFGEKAFSKYAYYGDNMLDNRCHYDLITMGNTEYVFVYLGYEPGHQSINWANQVFKKYSDRIGVLCVHEYLGSASELRAIGKVLQEQIVKANPNVYLVLCGHRYTEDCVKAQFDDNGDGKADRTVYQCIANYQNIDNKGGSGYMRFIEIDENKATMRFYTYSPVLDQYRSIPDTAKCQVSTLPIPWL